MMKHIFLIIGICCTGIYAGAQEVIIDTIKSNPKKDRDITIRIGGTKKDSIKQSSNGFSSKITFARFDLGFSKLMDNGSFSLSPANDFLKYNGWKSQNVGFDIVQAGYRFNRNFRVYVSGGLDWSHLRLHKNITVLRDQPVLTYSTDSIDYDKNRFTSSYLRIPLSFEIRAKSNKFHAVFGPEAGFLINGRVKQKSEENGKQKFNDDYHFSSFRYGTFLRIGDESGGIFVKYFLNDVFENSPAQEGLRNIAFGIMTGF